MGMLGWVLKRTPFPTGWFMLTLIGGLAALLGLGLPWYEVTYSSADPTTLTASGLTVAGPLFVIGAIVVVGAAVFGEPANLGRPTTTRVLIATVAASLAIYRAIESVTDPGRYFGTYDLDRGAVYVDGWNYEIVSQGMEIGATVSILAMVVVLLGVVVGHREME